VNTRFDEFFRSNVPRWSRFTTSRSRFGSGQHRGIVQNTLIKAMRKLGRYSGEASLFTWLNRSAAHELADCKPDKAARKARPWSGRTRSVMRLAHQLRCTAPRARSAGGGGLHSAAVFETLKSCPAFAQALEANTGMDYRWMKIAGHGGRDYDRGRRRYRQAREAFRERWARNTSQSSGVAGQTE